jgi:rhamnosyltransferase
LSKAKKVIQKSPSVAVLLALHNGERWIENQLDSILKQSSTSLHIFVSDDASTDNSLQNIQTKFVNSSRVSITLDSQYGSACKNFFHLIRNSDLSQYDYIALSDQDDIWQSEKIYNAILAIRKHQVDAYSGNVIAFWPDGTKKLINKAQTLREYDFMFESAGPGCTFVLTKKLALDLQLFLINHEKQVSNVALHDWFIYAFARSRGYKWFIDREPHMLYRQHDSNVVGANFGVKAKLIRWKKLREGWLAKQAILIADIIGYQQLWPIKRLKRFKVIDKCYLALNACKFRRRFRDQLAFAFTLFFTKKT